MKQVLRDIFQKIVEISNDKTRSNFLVDIDMVAFQSLMDEEEAANKYLDEESS